MRSKRPWLRVSGRTKSSRWCWRDASPAPDTARAAAPAHKAWARWSRRARDPRWRKESLTEPESERQTAVFATASAGRWSRTTAVALPSGASASGEGAPVAALDSISCVSAALCVASGEYASAEGGTLVGCQPTLAGLTTRQTPGASAIAVVPVPADVAVASTSSELRHVLSQRVCAAFAVHHIAADGERRTGSSPTRAIRARPQSASVALSITVGAAALPAPAPTPGPTPTVGLAHLHRLSGHIFLTSTGASRPAIVAKVRLTSERGRHRRHRHRHHLSGRLRRRHNSHTRK